MVGCMPRVAVVVACVCVFVCLGLFHPLPAHAATLTVTNCADSGASGDGSLRGEIAAAASGDTIGLTPGLTCTITLGSTLTLDTNLTIDATGATIAVDGNNAVTVFVVNPGVTATLKGLTIQHGKAV